MCPSCGGTCGYADGASDYDKKWIKADDNGQPMCPHCGAGESAERFERNLYIGFAIVFVVLIILVPILS